MRETATLRGESDGDLLTPCTLSGTPYTPHPKPLETQALHPLHLQLDTLHSIPYTPTTTTQHWKPQRQALNPKARTLNTKP